MDWSHIRHGAAIALPSGELTHGLAQGAVAVLWLTLASSTSESYGIINAVTQSPQTGAWGVLNPEGEGLLVLLRKVSYDMEFLRWGWVLESCW